MKSSATIRNNDSKGHLSPLSSLQCYKYICSPKAQVYWDMKKRQNQTFLCTKYAGRLLAGNATLVILLTVLLLSMSGTESITMASVKLNLTGDQENLSLS